jgi:hypothetical protein
VITQLEILCVYISSKMTTWWIWKFNQKGGKSLELDFETSMSWASLGSRFNKPYLGTLVLTSRIWIVIWQIDVETSIWQSNLKSHVNTSFWNFSLTSKFETSILEATSRFQFGKSIWNLIFIPQVHKPILAF